MFDGALPAYAVDVTGRKAKCLRTFIALKDAQLDAGTNSGWAHVAMLGEWRGHHSGEFEFTRDSFTQILKNFSAQSNPIPWDYEHDSFNPSTSGPKPASGWVKRMELRNNGTELWAYVDWTPRAAQMIRDGEYAYCSPVVDFESIDRKSGDVIGAELLSVALTNNPFLDGQHKIALTWKALNFPPPPPQSDKDKQPPADPQHAQQSAEPKGPPQQPHPPAHPPPFPPKEEDKQLAAPPPPAAPGPPPPAAADPNVADAALGDGSEADGNALLNLFADAAGLDKSQTIAALMDMKDMIVNALQKTVKRDGTPAEATRTMTVEKKPEAAQPAAPAAAPVVLSTPAAAPAVVAPVATAPTGLTLDQLERDNDKATIERMKQRLDALEAERAEEKKQAIAQLVDERIASGHVMPDQRDNAIWAFTQNRARAEQIYATQVVPIGQRQSTTTPAAAGGAQHTPGNEVIDMSQFSRAELMTIDCLMGARKTQAQAVAVVLKKRTDLKS